jgi:hypothetical protein
MCLFVTQYFDVTPRNHDVVFPAEQPEEPRTPVNYELDYFCGAALEFHIVREAELAACADIYNFLAA